MYVRPILNVFYVFFSSYFADFREFRVVLREDPRSIFAPNVQIENTMGPIHYDVSRIYTGALEGSIRSLPFVEYLFNDMPCPFLDHDDSIVHGILTENNLFDGSIITPTENYYVEPASRYSNELTNNGIHTIVYKSSDVHMLPHQMHQSSIDAPAKHDCASQRLHEKMMKQQNKHLDKALNLDLSDKNTINEHDSNEHLTRSKRWLADEVIHCVIDC